MQIAAHACHSVLILYLISPALGVDGALSPFMPGPITQEQEKEKEQQDKKTDSWPRTPEMIQEEMRLRAEIELRESERRKAIEAADEIITLAQQMKEPARDFDTEQALKTIEKLAKRILSFGGGKEIGQTPDDPPNTIIHGAEQILKLAEALRGRLEALDYRVMPVGVIDNSNAIIQLSGHLRKQALTNGARN